MRAQSLALPLLLTFGAFVFGLYLAPGHKEMAAMQMRDANYDGALKSYSELYEQGDDSIDVTGALINLDVYYGDAEHAIGLLERFVGKHPRSIDARKRLAALYKNSLRMNAYCDVLEQEQSLGPSVAILRELADTYDFLGRYPDEIYALTRLIASSNYKSRKEDYENLAVLDRVQGQPKEAIRVILAGLDSLGEKANIDTAHLAIELLLEDGQEDSAFTVTQNFLKRTRNLDDALEFSYLFQEKGKLTQSYAVLIPFLDHMDRSIILEQQVINIMLAQHKDAAVFDFLSQQFARKTLPPPLTVALANLALQRKDNSLFEAILRTADLSIIPNDDLLRYVEYTLQSKQPNLAEVMQNRLDIVTLSKASLLTAILNVAAHDNQETMAALLALPLNAYVTTGEKFLGASLFLQHGHPDRAYALFRDLSMGEILSDFDPIQISQIYIDTHQVEQGEKQIQEINKSSMSPALLEAVNKTTFLFAIGEGKLDEVTEWLKTHEAQSKNINFLEDGYSIASHYHRNYLTLEFAQRIYTLAKTPENLSRLTEALRQNGRYEEAIKTLQASAAQGGKAHALYIDTLTNWIQSAGKGAVSSLERDQLEMLVRNALHSSNMSETEKHDFAYLLQSAGFHDLAEGLFVDFAADKSFASADVKELLGFWGEHLEAPQLDWMTNRASHAPEYEKVSWLSYLRDAGHPERVISVMQNEPKASSELLWIYIDALEQTHNTRELPDLLAQLVDEETDPAKLKDIARKSDDMKAKATTEKAWRKAYDLDPEDEEIQHELALIAVDNRNWDLAAKLLRQYFQHNEGDYQLSNAYADVLQHQGKSAEANTYYKKALQQINGLEDKDDEKLIDQAHLLYINHFVRDAITVLRNILSRHPENSSVRAELAELLMEDHQYEGAKSVLSQ